MKTKAIIVLMAFMAGFIFYQCDEEDEEQTLSQEKLNSSTNLIKSFTGGDFPHGGSGVPADSTIREVYAAVSSLGSSFSEGQIITKKTYMKDMDGNKGSLLVTFAMFKRESGYDDANQNWEYVQMPYSADVNYDSYPNGMLSADNAVRGKLTGCIDCHTKAGGGDYVFTND